MANTTPPELVQAFQLIKSGNKNEAGRILKAYLEHNKQDAQAWFLMAHAVTKPEVAQRCLETVLKLEPDNAKARALLAKLTTEAAPPPAPPVAPADDPFAPTAPQAQAPRAAPVDDPFAPAAPQATPVDDPFAPVVSQAAQAAPVNDPFAPPTPTPATRAAQAVPFDDPFAPVVPPTVPVDDPFAEAAPIPVSPQAAQAAPFDDPFASDDPFAEAAPAAALVGDPFASGEGDYDVFPDDHMVLASLLPASAPTSAPAPAAKPEPAAPASFEDFLTTDTTQDPFAGPPVNDPFAEPAASEDVYTPGGGSYDPFAAQNAFDPTAAARLGQQQTAQTAGTGNQPEWGPGLGFIKDTSSESEIDDGSEVPGVPLSGAPGKPTPILTEDDLRVDRRRKSGNSNATMLMIIAGVIALFTIALVVYAIAELGFVNVTSERVPSMTTMDGGSFSMSYPKKWDQRCETDPYGYPVCGIANHNLYNEVDYFAGTDIDLGSMLGQAFSMSLTGEDLPDEQYSIIAMDVPTTSPSYDNSSWAKTSYEWGQWGWSLGAKTNYIKREITVDGYQAYYYEYTSEGTSKQAAWDVYIPHDGIMFWLRVDYWGERKNHIPHKTIAKIIESIDIKSS